ncbi:adenylate/guanylate cyclase domain-containing protein [Bradyrhizobium sp. G127]|uniref:adenylate/guanylate cyclase domain-containing protein n=1 Tax=Bradyrhizobium sp. G127 TaxID=2904800 RepID=UPI001F31B9E1|nr:adenylate/guanylate cyclase domain-containing protein [Bradyrhizobium sp. G127]MCF2523990.1 HAMP domain-containing protein [Bradyrhizobium sp. G127]
MIRQSIKRQIVGIAVGLIILMAITSVLSMVMSGRVATYLDELTSKYVQAYGHLARMNVRALEQALALRQMAIAKIQIPPDDASYAERKRVYEAKGLDVAREADGARSLINTIITNTTTDSDNATLARIDSRIESVNSDIQRYINEESQRLFRLLESRDTPGINSSLVRIDALRDDFNAKIDSIRADMLTQVRADAVVTMGHQRQAIFISAIVTALAAILGLTVSVLVSTGITRPVRRLLDGTRAVEAGHLDGSISITTRDEIGQLTAAFNRMVEQLRQNERVRETFGKYIDPQVVQGLIDRPALTASEGQRRTMTVLFCDMKGFTSLSEGMTPQGLVKVMNHYLSTMSEPIRKHKGIIDKYIGDGIMAYWGPPFTDENDHARLACLAALEMIDHIAALRTEIPELLGVRSVPSDCDLRIGIATGEVLVGSIGSEFMMSYTVMGDAVNAASRLELLNKVYGSRSLVSGATIAAAGPALEVREIDRVVLSGQTTAQVIFELMARAGELTPEQVLLRTRYSEGLAAYRARNWDEASRAFGAALEAVPADGPARTLAARVADFKAKPPAQDWNGAWLFDHK